jgi:O-antigen/teichoic acid export membrane protein
MGAQVTHIPPSQSSRLRRTIAKNSAANITRLGVTSLISVLLPPYLTHRLPVSSYGAWVLILQLSAYVGYLDFGVQTAVSKYIAEHQAKHDYAGCGRRASVGLVITLGASLLGMLLTLILAWQVPHIFRTMPGSLYHDMRLSMLFVGISLSASLATSVFMAIFMGLQRYQVPMFTTMITRLLSGGAICVAVGLHSSLPVMGACVAAVNFFGAALQIIAWRKLASHVRISFSSINFTIAMQMLRYCGVLTTWSICTLLISGLDLTIVGHYSFGETAFYSIANAPTSFILTVCAALMGPLLPATSALSVKRSSPQMGVFLLQATRYAVTLLFVTGLPFIVAGFPILFAWVGPGYALHSLLFLRVLVLANMIRQVCSPYATMVVATSRQNVATVSPITEAIVNLASSIWLAHYLGALGVALGTLLGAIAGVAVHFGISMRYTRSTLDISRLTLLIDGILRPASTAIPSLLLFWRWWPIGQPSLSPLLYGCWAASSALLVWFVAMNRSDRHVVVNLINARIIGRHSEMEVGV